MSDKLKTCTENVKKAIFRRAIIKVAQLNRLSNLMTLDYLTYMQNTSRQIYLHVP